MPTRLTEVTVLVKEFEHSLAKDLIQEQESNERDTVISEQFIQQHGPEAIGQEVLAIAAECNDDEGPQAAARARKSHVARQREETVVSGGRHYIIE